MDARREPGKENSGPAVRGYRRALLFPSAGTRRRRAGSLEQREDLLLVRRLFLDAKLAIADVACAIDQKRRRVDLDAAKSRQRLIIHHSNDVIHALALDEFLHPF